MKKIGIWGLGVTGRSLIRFLSKYDCTLGLLDKRILTEEEREFLKNHAVKSFQQNDHAEFFKQYERVIPNPTIDLRPFHQYAAQFFAELDLFASAHRKPLIAITGSLGKTSVTHLLSQTLKHAGTSVSTGGNIGVGMLDLIHEDTQMTLLELSSFQLEHSQNCTPDLAIITNICANHLDRHGTLDEYIKAKYQILKNQTPHHKALIHENVFDLIRPYNPQASIAVFSATRPQKKYPLAYYFDERGDIIKEAGHSLTQIKAQVPELSFPLNWLTVVAAHDLLNIPLPDLTSLQPTLPDHRLQHIATVNGIDFYDDSKSTVQESTLAALDRLSQRPIILLLGGMGKGVSREPLIKKIVQRIKRVVVFGGEAAELYAHAQKYGLPADEHISLESAFASAVTHATAGDQILLSPAGTSYDLFKDYRERGAAFQKCVHEYQKNK